MARSRIDPEYSVEDLKKEMCRNIDAAINKGFDGNEHPECMKMVDALFGCIYPVTPEYIHSLLTRRR